MSKRTPATAAALDEAPTTQPDQGESDSTSRAPADTAKPEEATPRESGVTQAPQLAIVSDNSDAKAGTVDASGDTEIDGEGVDADAPYGRRVDGTPAMKRGPKPRGASDEKDKQRARLRSVSQPAPKAAKVTAPNVSPVAIVNYQAMGESAASIFFGVGTLAFGDDWQPDTANGEHLVVAAGFRDYFKAKEWKDLPPGFALCFILGTYAIKRASKPTMRSKLQGAAAWVKAKAANLKR